MICTFTCFIYLFIFIRLDPDGRATTLENSSQDVLQFMDDDRRELGRDTLQLHHGVGKLVRAWSRSVNLWRGREARPQAAEDSNIKRTGGFSREFNMLNKDKELCILHPFPGGLG
jgi:hypothetical protein